MGAKRAFARIRPIRARDVARFRGREGFTLVEVLAAFAILAMLTVAVQRSVVMAKMGLLRADNRIAAERVAETLLSEPLSGPAVARGSRSGVIDGYRWLIKIEALDLPAAGGGPASTGRSAGTTSAPLAGAGARAGPVPPGENKQADGGESARWQPMRVTIEVITAPGRTLQLETVRLARVN